MNKFWKSFLEGFGSILCIYPTDQSNELRRHRYKTPEDDVKELSGDWCRVSEDLNKALERTNDEK